MMDIPVSVFSRNYSLPFLSTQDSDEWHSYTGTRSCLSLSRRKAFFSVFINYTMLCHYVFRFFALMAHFFTVVDEEQTNVSSLIHEHWKIIEKRKVGEKLTQEKDKNISSWINGNTSIKVHFTTQLWNFPGSIGKEIKLSCQVLLTYSE